MDFDLSWLLLGLPIAFVLGWLASRFDLRQLRLENRQAPKAYFRGLNFLLNEQQDQAIDAFIEAVQNDPDTQELHFALGNLFRRRGEYQRAVRVHEHLLSRGDLSRDDRDRAQHALAQDFLRAGLLDRAEAALQKLEGTRYENEARLSLLAIYERSREWAQAAEVAHKLDESEQASYATRRAHHLCEQAAEQVAKGALQEAARLLHQASELAPQAPRPAIDTAALQMRDGQSAAAFETLLALSDSAPLALPLYAATLQQAAVASQRSGEALALLQRRYAAYRRSTCSKRSSRWAERRTPTPVTRAGGRPRRATATLRTLCANRRWSRPRAGSPASASSKSSFTRRCSAPSIRPRGR